MQTKWAEVQKMRLLLQALPLPPTSISFAPTSPTPLSASYASCSLSLGATIMVSKNWSTIGEHVVIIGHYELSVWTNLGKHL